MLTHIHFALDKAKGGHSSTIWFFDTELHKQEELENYVESHMLQRTGKRRIQNVPSAEKGSSKR